MISSESFLVLEGNQLKFMFTSLLSRMPGVGSRSSLSEKVPHLP